jgi:hypothetical protein
MSDLQALVEKSADADLLRVLSRSRFANGTMNAFGVQLGRFRAETQDPLTADMRLRIMAMW